MLVGFALLVDDTILFVSDEDQIPWVEVVIFADALNNSLSHGNWALHKVVMSPARLSGVETPEGEPRQVLIKTSRVGDTEVLYCLCGQCDRGFQTGYELLDEFETRVTSVYKPEQLGQVSGQKEEQLKNICGEIVAGLSEKFETKAAGGDLASETFPDDPPRVHYVGISSQGLPIVSRLYDEEILEYLETLAPSADASNSSQLSPAEYVESTLSAKGATIAMNALFRAQANVDAIQIKIHANKYHFLYFRPCGQYTVELYASGNPTGIEYLLEKILGFFTDHPTMQQPFTGDLKTVRPLREILDNLPQKLSEVL